MRTVGLKRLKNNLSEYVRLAAAGETIIVTDRDRVVAEIVPPSTGLQRALSDSFRAQAVREGWLTPASQPFTDPPPRNPVATFREIMTELGQDREDR